MGSFLFRGNGSKMPFWSSVENELPKSAELWQVHPKERIGGISRLFQGDRKGDRVWYVLSGTY